MKLLGTRIIFKEIKEPKKTSIIQIEEEEPLFIRGEVIDFGHKCKLNIKKGDTILTNRIQAGIVHWKGEELKMIDEDDVIGLDKNK